MKLSDQVCSLKLSKRLKELGVEQTALSFWNNEVDPPKVIFSGYEVAQYGGFCSAFTVAELGELLKPFKLPYIYRADDGYKWRIQEDEIHNFDYEKMGKAIDFYYSNTEANARAKMLIYLIENNLFSGTLSPFPPKPAKRG